MSEFKNNNNSATFKIKDIEEASRILAKLRHTFKDAITKVDFLILNDRNEVIKITDVEDIEIEIKVNGTFRELNPNTFLE